MSTVDPQVARSERVAREKASGALPVLAIGVAALHLALWTLGGYGIATALDTFRLMETNQVGAWESPYGGDLWMLIIGIVLGSIGGFVVTGTLRQLLPGGAAAIAPMVTGLIGIGAGLALFYPSWSAPQEIGELRSFLDSGAERWGLGAWIWYELPIWLPALVGALGIACVILTVRVARSQTANLARTRSLIRAGVRVEGTVTQADSGTVFVNNLPVVSMTVKYADATGADRWVSQRKPFVPTSIPRVGDIYTVFYSAADPGNQKKIMLFPGRVTAGQAAAASWS
jgi:hypothetical protein